LEVTTVMTAQKSLTRVGATHVETGQPITAYEIHIGRTEGEDTARPFARVGPTPDGAVSSDGRVQGSYLHGLFASDSFRCAYLASLGIAASDARFRDRVEGTLEALADHIEEHLDVDGLFALAR
jgi:adenosylcobyric acid synthase